MLLRSRLNRLTFILLFVCMAVMESQTDATAEDAAALCTECAKPSLYTRLPSLQESMLVTRQRYAAWLAEQPAVRQSLEWGAWHATRLLPTAPEQLSAAPAIAVDLAAKQADGQAIWSACNDWPDGQATPRLAGPPSHVMYFTRTVRAPQATRIMCGMGGGERFDAWINGRWIASVPTALVFGRYGCSDFYEGSRVDQVLLDLDLTAGDNRLTVRFVSGGDPNLYFSPAPNPVPAFWKRLRSDFPVPEYPLLDLATADWFEMDGWFASQTVQHEMQLLDRLAEDCEVARAAIVATRESLSGQAEVDERRWLDLSVKWAVSVKLRGELERLRAAVEALGYTYARSYPASELLVRLEGTAQRLTQLADAPTAPPDEITRELLAELARLRREMLVDLHPRLRDAEIVFVKRHTYNSKHYYDDFQHISAWGGNLCVLALANGQTREIVPQLAGGVFDRYDLSFDVQKIVFGYRRPQPEGYRLYEIGVDGSGLRPVTQPPADEAERIATYGQTSYGDGFYGLQGYQFWTDDVHPCYLPDGGIAFASTRSEHGVLCTPAHYLACTNLYRVDADGSGMRKLSNGALSEFTPTLMDDGRILFNRWEYVYKGIAATQPLWTMCPDGAGSEEFYGDNIANPGVFWQARQVPGHPRLAVCVGCGHEPLGVGQVLLLDVSKDKRSPLPMTNLTPEVKIENLRGIFHRRNGVWREDYYGPLFADPYPLSDKFFLVSCNPAGRDNDRAGYGLYLLDVFGNCVPIYRDAEISCWQPMLLQPRPRPPLLPSVADMTSATAPLATVSVNDVYRGLAGVPRGTIKYLRVMEQVPKPWSAEWDQARGEDRSADGFGGHLAVTWNAHIWVAVLHGIVPVEEDGSARFQVPAGKNLFFQALDADFMEVQCMRTFVNFLPGETRSCVGCHEQRMQVPAATSPTAFAKPPLELSGQPGDRAPRPLYFPTDVQPILDQHCVHCHDGTVEPPAATGEPTREDTSTANVTVRKAPPDLRGELTELFSRSYENLLENQWVDTIREWNGADYSMMHAEPATPYAHGSHRSRLVALLRKGHYAVQLDREEFIRLVTWIDSGAPYYGSYFGRRSLQYRSQPDFRPVPTLSSATGVAPPVLRLQQVEPIPAVLLAWWPMGDESEPAQDALSNPSCAELSETAPADAVSDDEHGPRPFDGRTCVACSGLGTHEAISIALRVRADSLDQTWNPLLFGDDIRSGTTHVSLRADGRPNVAIHTGGQNWTHRTARKSVAAGQWHHLAFVCDARLGGSVRFYLDGQCVGSERLNCGIRLDLDGFRLGAWNQWADDPLKNFHGMMSDVRIYRGMLTDDQVTRLANP